MWQECGLSVGLMFHEVTETTPCFCIFVNRARWQPVLRVTSQSIIVSGSVIYRGVLQDIGDSR
jgi:hypothetical protein